MTEIKTYCDHCGKELDDMSDYIEVDIETAHYRLKADLCCECLEELHGLISTFVKERSKR